MSGVVQTFNNLTYSKEKIEGGRVKLSVEIANERFELAKNKVYERLAPSVTITGFRPGKAPRNLTEAQLGPTLYEETLGALLPECTFEILKREKITPLDQIAYNIEKVAAGSGVKYSAVFTVFPEFKLPDLKKIKVEKKKVEVTKEDIEKVVKQMFDESQKKAREDQKKDEKPNMDDKWAASLNLGVKNLSELRAKVSEELKRQKELVEQNRYIGEVLDEIVKSSKFDIPEVLINQEVARREKQYKTRIENLGMKVEDFLRNQKTTLEELQKNWKKEASKAIVSEIVLMQIAREYNIKVEDKEVEAQIEAIKDEKLKKQYQTPQAQRYILSVLLRQKIVAKILELVG